MSRHWTFGQKLGAGFAITIALLIAISVVTLRAMRQVVAEKDRVIDVLAHAALEAERLTSASERMSVSGRGFIIARKDEFLEHKEAAHREFLSSWDILRRSASEGEVERLLDEIARLDGDFSRKLDAVLGMRRDGADIDAVGAAFEREVVPARRALADLVEALASLQGRVLRDAQAAASDTADRALLLVSALAVTACLFAVLAAWLLTTTLGRQIGTAVGHVQSSSAELQAAANQQAAGAKEQATAMSEITTTTSELLASSRQIAESAQRVAAIAQETTRSAGAGEGTVELAHESIGSIRRQVDLVVAHMLELGRKSQEIGGVLEIVAELAEQTNILAINATIEAAGAGESGGRFAVVADEIRKLADRVAGSTKDIRVLIEDVRSAVNTTVMATETGSKAVDSGSRQFADVAAAFRQIAELVSKTTEAAREIGLSTKQQATAIEQVNLAIGSVGQASRETEASTTQTVQTAAELAHLSRDLLRLVQAQAAG
ncbi:MAG: methyl-accepting chemotaxis protein [Myxococcota bacterium]